MSKLQHRKLNAKSFDPQGWDQEALILTVSKYSNKESWSKFLYHKNFIPHILSLPDRLKKFSFRKFPIFETQQFVSLKFISLCFQILQFLCVTWSIFHKHNRFHDLNEREKLEYLIPLGKHETKMNFYREQKQASSKAKYLVSPFYIILLQRQRYLHFESSYLIIASIHNRNFHKPIAPIAAYAVKFLIKFRHSFSTSASFHLSPLALRNRNTGQTPHISDKIGPSYRLRDAEKKVRSMRALSLFGIIGNAEIS